MNLYQNSVAEIESEDNIRDAFRVFDKDGNGLIKYVAKVCTKATREKKYPVQRARPTQKEPFQTDLLLSFYQKIANQPTRLNPARPENSGFFFRRFPPCQLIQLMIVTLRWSGSVAFPIHQKEG